MCETCVQDGDVARWIYDIILAFCEEYPDADCGFGHIVLGDMNVEDVHILYCLNTAQRTGRNDDADVEGFLRWLLSVEELERSPNSGDTDEHV